MAYIIFYIMDMPAFLVCDTFLYIITKADTEKECQMTFLFLWVSKIFRGLKFRGHFRGLDFRGQFRGYFKWEIGESTCFFFYNISWLCSLLKGGNSWIILIFLNCWAYLMMALSVSIMLKLLAIRNMSIFQDRLYPLTALTAHAGCILKASIREKSSTLFYRILPALSLLLALYQSGDEKL